MQKEIVRVGEKRLESKQRGERARRREKVKGERVGEIRHYTGIDSRKLRSKESMQ